MNKDRWILLAGGAAFLTAPTALNLYVGNFGVWWAPMPVWIFVFWWIIGPFTVLIPPLLFLGLGSLGFKLRWTRAKGIGGWLWGSCGVLQLYWLLFYVEESIRRGGPVFTALIYVLGFSVLLVAGYLLRKAINGANRYILNLSILTDLYWFAWVSMPWVFEAI